MVWVSKKLGVSLFLSAVTLLIPLSAAFADTLDYFHWNSSSGMYVSDTYTVTGSYIEICADISSTSAKTYKLYEYDPDNPDDYVGSVTLYNGQCHTFYGMNNFHDGGNNAAELYFGTSSGIAGGYIYH